MFTGYSPRVNYRKIREFLGLQRLHKNVVSVDALAKALHLPVSGSLTDHINPLKSIRVSLSSMIDALGALDATVGSRKALLQWSYESQSFSRKRKPVDEADKFQHLYDLTAFKSRTLGLKILALFRDLIIRFFTYLGPHMHMETRQDGWRFEHCMYKQRVPAA
jgi:hypothetical protein